MTFDATFATFRMPACEQGNWWRWRSEQAGAEAWRWRKG
jgi:hypothetical protein